jgi:hypothetical protein
LITSHGLLAATEPRFPQAWRASVAIAVAGAAHSGDDLNDRQPGCRRELPRATNDPPQEGISITGIGENCGGGVDFSVSSGSVQGAVFVGRLASKTGTTTVTGAGTWTYLDLSGVSARGQWNVLRTGL